MQRGIAIVTLSFWGLGVVGSLACAQQRTNSRQSTNVESKVHSPVEGFTTMSSEDGESLFLSFRMGQTRRLIHMLKNEEGMYELSVVVDITTDEATQERRGEIVEINEDVFQRHVDSLQEKQAQAKAFPRGAKVASSSSAGGVEQAAEIDCVSPNPNTVCWASSDGTKISVTCICWNGSKWIICLVL